MSQFYGSMSGQGKTQVTRGGGKNSGIQGHIRGWNVGVKVYGYVGLDGADTFCVSLSSGSSGNGGEFLIGTFTQKDIKRLKNKELRAQKRRALKGNLPAIVAEAMDRAEGVPS